VMVLRTLDAAGLSSSVAVVDLGAGLAVARLTGKARLFLIGFDGLALRALFALIPVIQNLRAKLKTRFPAGQ
jgi:hypothetical protein